MDAPKKWRFRFRLRALLVALAILAIPLTWVGYSLRWIQQRRAFLRQHAGNEGNYYDPSKIPDAPGLLWMYGESPVYLLRTGSNEQGDLLTESEILSAERLFPEAKIWDSNNQKYRVLPNP